MQAFPCKRRAGDRTDSLCERMSWSQERAQGEGCVMENKSRNVCVWAVKWVSGGFLKSVFIKKKEEKTWKAIMKG